MSFDIVLQEFEGGDVAPSVPDEEPGAAAVPAYESEPKRVLGGRAVPTTAIIAETLVSDWLVDIEVIATG